MWMLLLKICLLTTLFYSLYHWALRGNTFFRFNRVYLLAGMLMALALPFVPLYYAVPTVSEADLSETAFRIGNIISIEMKVNESVNFSQIGCFIYISGLIVLLLSRMWTVFRLMHSQRFERSFLRYCFDRDTDGSIFFFFPSLYSASTRDERSG